ncbi:hypothetical protein GCM10010441_20450 [Kitasatospora paracochleata]|uniref:Squalene cyclase C-terminal domain-containing protein n=1 Tax=Kitasatospora paracochleata TaxID=58354 RepID=A0ABT1J813_9ACTN|nr:hypothetical protein [Kitasatospora paracochleata]MCP2313577.1 hypothetical protein [Kitasatospora paracochleata]
MTVAPFTAALITFKTVLDYAPKSWFPAEFLQYLFAGLCALCVGLSIRLLGAAPGAPRARAAGARGSHGTAGPSAHTILTDTARGVAGQHRTVTHQGTVLHGWPQYLNDPVPPTAVGTSYGVRILALLDLYDASINRHDLSATLLALQRPGGGWAASTQRQRGRPEVTSWVIASLCRLGMERGAKQQLVAALEDMLEPRLDPVGMASITVVSTAVSALSEVAPTSSKLPELARRLLDGGHHDQQDSTPLLYWGETQYSSSRSVAHTARAAIALNDAARALPGNAGLASGARAAVDWLCRSGTDFHLVDEQLRRPVADGTVDALFIGHFTAAWVAQAILDVGVSGGIYDDCLAKAMRDVVGRQENGLWRWHDGSIPIWMTQQGAQVIKDHALRNPQWLL